MKKKTVLATVIIGGFLPLVSRAAVTLTNPLGETDVRLLIARVIQGMFSISGSIALIMFIYGGFLWLTSGGKSEQITKGKQILFWATAGIVLIVGAYVIVNAIFNALLSGNVNGSTS
ncbi:hypothetical protein D6827_02065 [Candidatus Parcubacteria bacterium]|nr:MAG: hypothetical protein D6827_02065 [Candidatus Parcubacteria bacterium]